jgi:hypothetical protein
MPACRLHRPENAEPGCSTHATEIAFHALLRNQIVKGCVKVLRPLRLVVLAATLAAAAAIDREGVDAGGGKLARNAIPRAVRAIGLMVKQHAGAGLRRGEVGGL